jgi:hypothetical protein
LKHTAIWHWPPLHCVIATFGGGGQSAAVQHDALGMQLFDPAQGFWPAGHWQVPPGAEQVSPATVQSAFVQHSLFGMQLFVALHACVPVGQPQLPPMALQTSPVSGQSLSTQQLPVAMHCGIPIGGLHTRCPIGQVHAPPGLGQPSPMTAVQSALVQQEPSMMQLFEAVQTCWPIAQVHMPPGPVHI